MPVEGLAHDGGLLFADLDPAGLSGGHADLAVAVGDGAGDHLSLAGPPELAAAVPVHDLGALELGHRRLDLREQPSLGVIGVASLQEDDRHAEAGEFFEHERLVHVVAGQAVGAKRATASMRPAAAASRTWSSPGRSRRAPEWPSSAHDNSTTHPSAAALAWSASTWEPIVRSRSWRSVDTRAYRATLIACLPSSRCLRYQCVGGVQRGEAGVTAGPSRLRRLAGHDPPGRAGRGQARDPEPGHAPGVFVVGERAAQGAGAKLLVESSPGRRARPSHAPVTGHFWAPGAARWCAGAG